MANRLLKLGLLATTLLLLSPFLFDFDGYTFFKVITSDSMKPVVTRGDLMFITKVWDVYSQVDVGDILVFKSNTPVGGVIHRVYEKSVSDKSTMTNPNYDIRITTKGDDNPVIQPYESSISSDLIIGKVIYVVKAPASYVIIFTPILMIFLYSFYHLFPWVYQFWASVDYFVVKKHEVGSETDA